MSLFRRFFCAREESDKDKFKKEYLHPDALKVAHGVCADGQAYTESLAHGFFANVIKGYRYRCVLDNFCCQECWPLDGIIFPINQNQRPPIPRHENCRCLYMPVTKTFREQGLDMDEFDRVPRNWTIRELQTTYKNNPNKLLKTPKRKIISYGKIDGNAEDWIKTLPESLQKEFFKSEFAFYLWKESKIKAIELINQKTWKLKSDEELALYEK